MFVKTLKPTVGNVEDSKQLVRSSGSVGANYIEANESVSKKDFIYRAKISRKEAKESTYWLRLIATTNDLENAQELEFLINESREIVKILSAMIERASKVDN